VIDYRLHNVPGSEPLYRLITTILGPLQAPAKRLAAPASGTAVDPYNRGMRSAELLFYVA